MSDGFRPSCSGTLTATLSKQPDSEHELSWYLRVSLKPVNPVEEVPDCSILFDHMFLTPMNWLKLEEMEHTSSNGGFFYDGYEGIHYPLSHFFVKFLKRNSNIFQTQISVKLEENIYLPVLSRKEIESLTFQADIKFEGLKILESCIETPYANFTNPKWMRNFVAKYISLDHLEGPFYPFPLPEPYSKTSSASFTPFKGATAMPNYL